MWRLLRTDMHEDKKHWNTALKAMNQILESSIESFKKNPLNTTPICNETPCPGTMVDDLKLLLNMENILIINSFEHEIRDVLIQKSLEIYGQFENENLRVIGNNVDFTTVATILFPSLQKNNRKIQKKLIFRLYTTHEYPNEKKIGCQITEAPPAPWCTVS